MNTDLDLLTEKIIGCVFEVANTLGAGFLEKVYRRALLRELRLRGIRAETEVPFAVAYKGQTVGEYFADLLVNFQRPSVEYKRIVFDAVPEALSRQL